MKCRTKEIKVHLDPWKPYNYGSVIVNVHQEVGQLYDRIAVLDKDIEIQISSMPKEVIDAAEAFFVLVATHVEKKNKELQ